MQVYMDNSATTRVYPEAVDIMIKTMTEDFGNPSSLHNKGLDAEHYVRAAAEKIAKALRCSGDEITFTSGGTESNNMAIVGSFLAKRRKGSHIVCSAIEHASVLSVMKFLEGEGCEVTYIDADERGYLRPEDFAAAVRADTILVSCMQVNNEIGTVQPVAEIARAVKAKNKDVYFHVDAIQSFGKVPVYPARMGIDLLSVSGHKLHGPKGSGFLYIRKGTLVRPIIYGGGQQRNMRSGTENVPAIAGLGVAVEKTFADMDERVSYISGLRDKLVDGLTAVPEVYCNTYGAGSGTEDKSGTAPHIASISFVGVRAEVMLHALEDKGIYVSSGSACSSNKKRESAVLRSVGMDADRLESTLRFSLCEDNTEEEVDYVISTVTEMLPMLRHYVRG